VSEGVLVIRSHGVAPAVIDEARRKGLTVVDATCPHVSKAHGAARQLHEQGYRVIVVGEPGHPEVEGILAYAGSDAIVVQRPADLPEDILGGAGAGDGTGVGAADGARAASTAGTANATGATSTDATDGADPDGAMIGIVVQTTQAASSLDAVVDALYERGITPLVHNTICLATRQRQKAAIELASKVDAMVVVGGRNSSNTTRLAQLCQDVCPRTHHIESVEELSPAWFEGVEDVGITAGASTPKAQIIAVEQALELY
jgi:4-hydroxy-3-methylbut-2-enyl diphosphate reductase